MIIITHISSFYDKVITLQEIDQEIANHNQLIEM